MGGFVRAILDEGRRTGLLRPWEWFLLLVAAMALSLLGRETWAALRSIEWKVEPAPQPISDGGQASDRDLPPAREGGGPPGGDPTGGMGG